MFQFKSKDLEDKQWNGSRDPKLIVEVLNQTTKRPVDITSFVISNKETLNRYQFFYDVKTDECVRKPSKHGGIRRKDALILFDREYSDENHLRIEFLMDRHDERAYQSPPIGFMKENSPRFENIPIFRFEIDPKNFSADFIKTNELEKDWAE